MFKTLEETSATELRTLVDFSRSIIVKAQEEADVAERIALQKAGQGFIPVQRMTRDWAQIVAYSSGDGALITRREGFWTYRAADSTPELYAVDEKLGLWYKLPNGSWFQPVTGQVRTVADSAWRQFNVPGGESYVDPVNARALIPTLIWIDRTTGDTSSIGPGSGDFIGEATPTTPHPDGLSDLIPTPQEYVTALIRLALGTLNPADKTALEEAIASFEAPGPWEDVRQPFFAVDQAGNLRLRDDGTPEPNPFRVVQVAYRGELNDYYRAMVRDRNISPAKARMVGQFEIIDWQQSVNMTTEECRRFVTAHTESVRVYKTAFYSESMDGDALYLRYSRMFIAWMTVMRVINERMDGVGDIDRMSPYDLTNLLYSFGIYQFDDLPTVYRRRLAKNIEKILSVKGTTQVFRDILSLFNLEKDLRIWKHYLVRYFPSNTTILQWPRMPAQDEWFRVDLPDGRHFNGTDIQAVINAINTLATWREAIAQSDGMSIILKQAKDNPDSISAISITHIFSGAVVAEGEVLAGGPDYGLPEVGFQRVDIDDPAAETTVANLDTSFLSDYNEFVSSDVTWETSREDARDLAFSVMQTKYFSMSSAVDTVYNGMSLGLLWGMLKDAQIRGRAAPMLVPGAGSLGGVAQMNLVEAFTAILTLTLWRFGVDDIIPHGESGVSQIVAARTDGSPFPNESTLLPFSTVLERVAALPEPLIPQALAEANDRNILTNTKIDQALVNTGKMGDVFGAYDPVRGGEETRSVNQAFELRAMWDHKFISTYQTEAFGSVNKYSEWMEGVNPELAAWMQQIDSSQDYINGVLSIILLVEDAIDAQTLNLPAATGMTDIVMMYAQRLILFFKAYTTDLRSFSTFMLIDRPAHETVRLMNLLAGLNVKWKRSDGLDELDDMFATLATWSFNEGTPESLFTDMATILSQLRQQDIATIFDTSKWNAFAKIANPAAVMRDLLKVTSKDKSRDALTVHTKHQKRNDVKVLNGSRIVNGLFMPLMRSGPTTELGLASLSDELPANFVKPVIVTYEPEPPPTRRTQGLSEQVRITPN